MYSLDDDSAAAEDSPNVISPDSNAGTKRWLLQGITVPLENDPANPEIAFGDGDTGFYERLDDHLSIAIAGSYKARLISASFVSATGSGFSILFAAGSATVPSYAYNGDEDTGLGRAGADAVSLIAGAIEGLRLTEIGGGVVPQYDTTATITAYATGGQANAVQLISAVSEISVCATGGDSVKLPTALAGSKITIINNGATSCDVFPATSDNLGAGVDTAVPLASGETVIYQAYDATNWKTVSNPTVEYIKLHDSKATTTDGGTFTLGAWRKRTVTEDQDTGNNVSVASSVITLEAGTYDCLITCPAYAVTLHQARLYNTADTAVTIYGTNGRAPTGADAHMVDSVIRGRFTITAQKTFEIQHRGSSTNADTGFGIANDFGGDEIYTVAEFWKRN